MSKQEVSIQVEHRVEKGNGPSRRLRRIGKVPGVLYGKHNETPVPMTLTALEVKDILHHIGLVHLSFDKQTPVTAILKEVQRECITGAIQHVDFQKVAADELISFMVELEAVGVPAGAVSGGQLEQVLRAVEVKCRAIDMFDHLRIDVSGMNLNETLHVRELQLPHDAKAVTDGAAAIFHVRLPKMAAGADDAKGADADGKPEPEVIAKGKKPEDGEAAPAAGAKKK